MIYDTHKSISNLVELCRAVLSGEDDQKGSPSGPEVSLSGQEVPPTGEEGEEEGPVFLCFQQWDRYVHPVL